MLKTACLCKQEQSQSYSYPPLPPIRSDHPGVTNRQLVQEKSRLARIFDNKSVAEQNSFQCAWDLLMDPCFDQLRSAIYTTKEELHHFRQLVVNAVVATDLIDQDLCEQRTKRWDLAFPENGNPGDSPEASIASRNCRAAQPDSEPAWPDTCAGRSTDTRSQLCSGLCLSGNLGTRIGRQTAARAGWHAGRHRLTGPQRECRDGYITAVRSPRPH